MPARAASFAAGLNAAVRLRRQAHGNAATRPGKVEAEGLPRALRVAFARQLSTQRGAGCRDAFSDDLFKL